MNAIRNRSGRITNRLVVASLACAISAAACGTEEHDVVSMLDARTSVQQVATLSGSLPSMDNMFVQLLVMGSANQRIVTPRGEPHGRLGLFPSMPAMSTPNAGTVECMAGSCTFTNYGHVEGYQTYLIDGTIARSGDTSTFDLTLRLSDYFEIMHWMISGSVTTLPTRVDGTLHSHGVGRSAHGSTPLPTWDIAVDFAAITLDTQGCPTSGTVHAMISYVYPTDTGPIRDDEAPSYWVEGTVPFGPTCQ